MTLEDHNQSGATPLDTTPSLRGATTNRPVQFSYCHLSNLSPCSVPIALLYTLLLHFNGNMLYFIIPEGIWFAVSALK